MQSVISSSCFSFDFKVFIGLIATSLSEQLKQAEEISTDWPCISW